MGVKKNLTVAGLAALLAVPALGTSSANAADVQFGDDANPIGKLSWNGHNFGNFNHNGHYFSVTQPVNVGGTVTGFDGNTGVSNIDVANALGGGQFTKYIKEMGEYTGSSNSDGNGNENNNENTSGSSNSTQYASQGRLPQTGEINHQVSALETSIILGATGIGLGAISMKKHKKDKDMANVASIQTNSSSDNGIHRINSIINTLGAETNKLNNYIHQIVSK